ncbi:MAG: penicillin-binding protein 2 [Chloroflexota bacterium]
MERELERRFNALALLVVFVFATLFGRVGYLQIIRRERYEKLAEGNRIRLIPTVAPRGVIYDRNGVPIVNSRPAYTVSLIPLGDGIDPAVLDRLAEILGMSRADLDQLIAERQGRAFEPIRIASDITPEMHTRIEEARYELPGVVVDVQPVRNYIYGEAAAQILGYVRQISDSQLKSLEAKGITDYKMGDLYGQMGIENKLDAYLRGIDGGRQVEVDSMGRPIRIVGEQIPVAGNDVTLTLDMDLQKVAEQSLRDSLANLQRQGYKAYAGAVVVEDVRTGEILAITSLPSFDPNIFNGILTTDMYNQLFKNPLNPFNNRILTGTFAPGSTFKMAVAAAALEEGVVTPTETLFCSGSYKGKGCWVRSGHGRQNIVQALQNSCNVFFYQMGERLGPDRMAKYAKEFGFGQLSGIDVPGERAGVLPSTAWKLQAKQSGLLSEGQWWPGETLDMAIGQGYDAFTPLQLVNYVATLANGGTRRQPYLISQIRDPDGKVIQQTMPKVLNQVSVSQETLNIVRQGMAAVASEGTAAWVFKNYPIKVAGKTGTAETGRADKNNGWFVAYAPYDNPEIAVTVVVEGGGHGSTSGAPVTKAIFDQYFHLPTTPKAPASTVTTPSTGGQTNSGTPANSGTPTDPGTPTDSGAPTTGDSGSPPDQGTSGSEGSTDSGEPPAGPGFSL